jgi:hypothetical protein
VGPACAAGRLTGDAVCQPFLSVGGCLLCRREEEQSTGRLVEGGKGRVSDVEESRFIWAWAELFRLSLAILGADLLRSPSLVEPYSPPA